jgi:glycosyltransferase involved in cell wall biosynthesis
MIIGFAREPLPSGTAWGGGNVLHSHLSRQVALSGHAVTYTPSPKIDVIYITDPRGADAWYDCAKKHNIPIVQRIGDVGTHGKDTLFHLLRTRASDIYASIYPSNWARDYIEDRDMVYRERRSYVIRNTAASEFKPKLRKVVTHHWSDNQMKGADIYSKLQEDATSLNIKFTFIGRPCFEIKPPTRLINPVEKDILAELLCDNDIYVTASRYEAGANHILEAIACGIPIYYHRDGGSIAEYCKIHNAGTSYMDYNDLKMKLSCGNLPDIHEVCGAYMAIFRRAYEDSSGSR